MEGSSRCAGSSRTRCARRSASGERASRLGGSPGGPTPPSSAGRSERSWLRSSWRRLCSSSARRPTAVCLGAGGRGCPAALALAEEKAGIRLVIVDPDRVERSNLARQILYSEADIGAPKAEIAALRTGAEARVARFEAATANELL